MLYADIIVNISVESLDRTYQYIVPMEWIEKAVIGAPVHIPFGKGNRLIQGYIVGLSHQPKIKISQIKSIQEVLEKGLVIEAQLLTLAYWIKENYGSTLNDALRTVIPVKKSIKNIEKRYIRRVATIEETKAYLQRYENNKSCIARVRLMEALLEEEVILMEFAVGKLNISRQTVKSLEDMGMIKVESETIYRNPVQKLEHKGQTKELNPNQQVIVNEINKEYKAGIRSTYLLHGITGSGKTEVYMEIIAEVVAQGKQVIMLIPEIALTYQTVMRFYHRFGERISILNSRMSAGERYDQYMRAKGGDIDIMIGPRSALFTPFPMLGLIIIDEEHEGSYKSEMPPKYHAREVAIERGRLANASVILGSATPSLEAYKRSQDGIYKRYTLSERAGKGRLPQVWVADLREEFKHKNRTMFSRKLRELMEDRLQKKQQVMLFINRRGYAGFVSCRSCGYVIKCPHCDISLTLHQYKSGDRLSCHYCGYEEPMKKTCPSCKSRYIAAFGTGTQKVEELVKREFPLARVLRMDTDTTAGKGGHEKILAAFANQEADILVGTQMIVKGHDFPKVTLVGILAADLSLHVNDYRAAEKTFQLLMQAAGRAGRGVDAGEVVIQTYNPEHYSVLAAAHQDYLEFYNQEIAYRKMLQYPPISVIMAILVASENEDRAERVICLLNQFIEKNTDSNQPIKRIGPAKASLSKANDIYRRVLYLKSNHNDTLIKIKDRLEQEIHQKRYDENCNIQFDFNPINSY